MKLAAQNANILALTSKDAILKEFMKIDDSSSDESEDENEAEKA